VLTFLLEEEVLGPDASHRGEHGESDHLPGLQVGAEAVHLPPALVHVEQQHLPVHVQGTLQRQRRRQRQTHRGRKVIIL